MRTQLDEQKQRLTALNEAYEAQTKRMQRLENRLEVLEDQREAQSLHGGAPKPLPVVRLEAPNEQGDDEDEGDGHADPELENRGHGGGYVLAQDDLGPLATARSENRSPRGPVPPPDNAAFAGNIGTAALPGAAAARSPAPALPPAADDLAISLYKQAYRKYKGGDLAGAITAFQTFVQHFPDHDYSDNALQLVGQAHFDRAELAVALTTFRRVVESYPGGNRVPDALLMIGLTLERLGRPAEGRETLARLRTLYPDTTAAQHAEASLRGSRM